MKMRMKLSLHILVATLSLIAAMSPALACPDVGGLPDVNCDGTATVVVVGDSLVSGIGDTKNEGKGGYVLRTQSEFREATFFRRGTPGLRTVPLLQKLKKAFLTPLESDFAQELLTADLVVLDVGRNDRWLMGLPSATFRNLKKARGIIEQSTLEQSGKTPLVVLAVLMLPNRGSQGPWVKQLNEIIFSSHSKAHPADLRFDQVSKRLLSPDSIHPTSKGYAALSKVFISYLKNEYPEYVAARDDH
jgi:lysophospholipase L1-like esterase